MAWGNPRGTFPGHLGATKNLQLPEVISLILPNRENLRGTELQRVFCCGPDLLSKLSADREIEQIAEDLPTDGPNSSPHFKRSGIAKFLETRRVL
jgi:hypothetical protein